MGTKLNVPSLASPDVQEQSDAQLTDAITKGKNKMPAYNGKLTNEQIAQLVAYVRESWARNISFRRRASSTDTRSLMENVVAPTPTTPRRGVVEFLLGGGVLASIVSFVYPVLRYLIPPRVADLGGDEVVASKVSDLKPNGSKIFRFGNRPALLLMTATGEYRALSAVCTHLSCTVQYRKDLEHIWCACHNGHYDLNGRNISGPPPRPLEQFQVHVRGDEIVVVRKREV